MPDVWYMAVTNDAFEIPVCVADTAAELAIFMGIRCTSVLSTLYRSPNGYGTSMDNRLKYFRMNADTGEVFVGKLPGDIAFKQSTQKGKAHGQSNSKRAAAIGK